MFKVGITGGIGSGKTHVCKVFELLGVPVFYADEEAKRLMVSDVLLMNEVEAAFGPESYLEPGKLNTNYIANIVFNDKEQLAKLNALVHPAVFRAFNNWANTIEGKNLYVLKEAALLFESGGDKMCDTTLLVTAPMNVRMERVMERDNASPQQVAARIEKQFTDLKKLELTNHHLINDANKSIIEQVLVLHKVFLKASVESHR